MHPVIYDVAVSLDGYISGPDGDISQFAHDGPVVDDYSARLATYRTAIMGRSTYEFGYRFGLEPGQNPYPHMKTIVFSRTLDCPRDSAITVVREFDVGYVEDLKTSSTGPIYLCGGGRFAGSLLAAGVIDMLRLKRAPIILGSGVGLFGRSSTAVELVCTETRQYEAGYIFQEFRI